MRKSIQTLLFSQALGMCFSLLLFSYLLPLNLGMGLFAPLVLALFWGYLSVKQNLSIGVIRLLVLLPGMIKSTIQQIVILDIRVNSALTVLDTIAVKCMNASSYELFQRNLTMGISTEVIPPVTLAKTFLWIVIPIEIIISLSLPYVLHLILKRIKFYDRIPIKP